MSKNQIKYIIGALLTFIFLSPIIAYISQFGIGVWNEHSKWAEMGSAFSGIYSPLIALLAFFILFGQVRAQSMMNKHIFDQAFISDVIEELNFYIDRLDKNLDELLNPESTARAELARFSEIYEKNLDNEKCREDARKLLQRNRKVFDIWVAIYPLLRGLGVNKTHPYELSYNSSILKVSTVISMETCIALDKVYYSSYPVVEKGSLIYWKG